MLLLALSASGHAHAAPAKPSKTVYKVPKQIKATCSVPVEGQIMNWLATVPDGSTVQFGAGGCYGQDGTITLNGRRDVVIDGQGS